MAAPPKKPTVPKTKPNAMTVDAIIPPPPAPALKLRDLVGRVVEASGGNKKGVKEIVEATLTQLGAALANGEELNLPGLGKVRVARTADHDGRVVMTLKLRSAGPARAKQPLADDAEAV